MAFLVSWWFFSFYCQCWFFWIAEVGCIWAGELLQTYMRNCTEFLSCNVVLHTVRWDEVHKLSSSDSALSVWQHLLQKQYTKGLVGGLHLWVSRSWKAEEDVITQGHVLKSVVYSFWGKNPWGERGISQLKPHLPYKQRIRTDPELPFKNILF